MNKQVGKHASKIGGLPRQNVRRKRNRKGERVKTSATKKGQNEIVQSKPHPVLGRAIAQRNLDKARQQQSQRNPTLVAAGQMAQVMAT